MPRVSKEVKDIAEKNQESFLKCPIFELWMVKHLRNRERAQKYKQAYDLVHAEGDSDVKEDS